MVNSSLASGDEKPNKISANEIVIERAWEFILDLKRVIFFVWIWGKYQYYVV